MEAKGIFAFTEAGDTPKMLASFMPCCPIFAVTQNVKTFRQLALVNNVTPILVKEDGQAQEIISKGIKKAIEAGFITNGDIVCIAGGEKALPDISNVNNMNRTIGGVVRV